MKVTPLNQQVSPPAQPDLAVGQRVRCLGLCWHAADGSSKGANRDSAYGYGQEGYILRQLPEEEVREARERQERNVSGEANWLAPGMRYYNVRFDNRKFQSSFAYFCEHELEAIPDQPELGSYL